MGAEQATVMERVRRYGLHGVSQLDLLAIMLTREERDLGRNENTVGNAFRNVPLVRLKDLSYEELHSVGGLEQYEATRLLAALELGRKIGVASQGQREAPVTRSQEAYELFRHLADEEKEHFCAAFLDSKAQPIGTKVVHIGTLNASVVGAREVFREAVRHNAASVIVAHNHPSGDPEPSPEDIKVTEALKKAGDLLDIPLLDHVIIGHNGRYVSLCDRGHL
ncbi:MAG: DNA repair protein RadC [Armatimonadetes bacterium]|nr:DNA repair protein RadC [Armatimonadota bacterium]